MPYGLGAVCVYQRLGQRVCWSAAKAGYWDIISLVGKEPELLCLRVTLPHGSSSGTSVPERGCTLFWCLPLASAVWTLYWSDGVKREMRVKAV